jgi:hypothetical protein
MAGLGCVEQWLELCRDGRLLPREPRDGYWTRAPGAGVSFGRGMSTAAGVALVRAAAKDLEAAGFPVVILNREKGADAAFVTLPVASLADFHPIQLPSAVRDCGGWTVVAGAAARGLLGMADELAAPAPPGGAPQ